MISFDPVILALIHDSDAICNHVSLIKLSCLEKAKPVQSFSLSLRVFFTNSFSWSKLTVRWIMIF